MGFSVHIDLSNFDKKYSKANLTEARFKAAENARQAMNAQYVPYYEKDRNGHLRDSSYTTTDGAEMVWNILYAHYQYVHDFDPSHYHTPGTGGHWDLKLKGNKEDMRLVTQTLINSLNKGAK